MCISSQIIYEKHVKAATDVSSMHGTAFLLTIRAEAARCKLFMDSYSI
jgi:hypothetical protein